MLSFTLSGKTYTWTTNNIDRRKLNRILDLFHIISCIIVFASFLYFYVDFLSCSYTVHVSYTFIYRILSYNLSYTVLYFIYTYSYNFYYLSSLHAYCMSISFATCSMSLAYLLSIFLLYSCFYTLHIPYSFYNLFFYVFDISFIYTFISSYTIMYFYLHSYTFHIRYFCML